MTSYLEALCQIVSIQGSLNASTFVWSGQYIGGSSISSKPSGQLLVTRLAIIKRGSYNTKYIRGVVWTNLRNFTVDSSMDSSSRYVIYCRACLIINEATSTMTSNRVKLSLDGGAGDSNVFSVGIVNRGLLIFELVGATSVYLDVKNDVGGRINVIGKLYKTIFDLTLNCQWINDGIIQFYGVSVNFYLSSAGSSPSQNGTWEVYSYPYRSPSLPTPLGHDSLGTWKTYLDDAYVNVSKPYWDMNYVFFVRIRHEKTFYNFTAFGRVVVLARDSRFAIVRVNGAMNLGEHGKLELVSSLSSNDGNVFSVPKGLFRAGIVSVGAGWTLDLGCDDSVAVTRLFTVSDGGRAQIGSIDGVDVAVRLGVVVGVQRAGRFNVWNRNATIDGDFITHGFVNLTKATLSVTGEWRFIQGSLLGDDESKLNVLSVGNITGSFTKTINGVDINVEASSRKVTNSGVIAEYFQYRVDTEWRSSIKPLYYFPGDESSVNSLPSEFDSSTYQPNAARFVSSFDRLPRYYGSSPLALEWNLLFYDLENVDSFTSFYAVRLWSFLQIDEAGLYVFHFATGYGLHVRLWVNGKTIFTSLRRRHFFS